jgi:hypothetical protein
MAVASLILAIIAILIAGASAAYTRKQATEQARVASIEQGRRHDELTPEFKITCDARDNDGNRAELNLELTGPAGLTELNQVTVRIRDDIPGRKPRDGSKLTQEQVAAVIWGPYRIVTGLRDTDSNGRAHGPFQLLKNELLPLIRWSGSLCHPGCPTQGSGVNSTKQAGPPRDGLPARR